MQGRKIENQNNFLSNYQWVYRDSSTNRLVLSGNLPARQAYTQCLALPGALKVLPDLDLDLLQHIDLAVLKLLVKKLCKAKLVLPADFWRNYLRYGDIVNFVEQANFSYLKGELPQIKEQLQKQPLAEQLAFWRFATGLGCFSDKKLLNKDQKVTDVAYGQKASAALGGFLREQLLCFGDFQRLFAHLPINLEPDQSFLQFINQKDKHGYPNMEMLLTLEKTYPHFFSTIMSEFAQAQEFRRTLDAFGAPKTLPWNIALSRYYNFQGYQNVNQENADIAEVFGTKGLSQEIFQQTAKLRKKAMRKKGFKHHLLGHPLTEISQQTDALLHDSQELLEALYAREFTYEMLDKSDPRNAIMGLYTSCCASINSFYYGKKIAEKSIAAPDAQNMVIRDRQGDIIAKSIMYVNAKQSYAVLNAFELNTRYRHHEIDYQGYYDVDDDDPEEQQREQIFAAFQRGVKAFVQAYDAQNPNNNLQIVTVGMGYNHLKRQCERLEVLTHNYLVPLDYDFRDAGEVQYILYQRPKNLELDQPKEI